MLAHWKKHRGLLESRELQEAVEPAVEDTFAAVERALRAPKA